MLSLIHAKLIAKKVAIYIRVSTHWQIDKDSLQVQRRELIAYAQMVLGIQDFVVFEDPGYSAKNTDRPDYQKMMDRLRTGEFSHLLVWKIDRISRNLLDFANMYDELKKLGVTFVSKNEQFDTSSAIGEAMLKIILIFAELERNMTAERVTAVMLSRANNGQWNGGRVPYGYAWSKATQTFSIVEEEAKTVLRMADLYEQYQSLLYVTKYLNDAGITTRSGKMRTPTTIHKILRNPWYTGKYVYNVHSDQKGSSKREESEWITIEQHHEPLMDEERFNRLKFLLERNSRNGAGHNGKTYIRNTIHLFAGLLRCGICGSSMTANSDRIRANGYRPSQYTCSKRRRMKTDCTNKYISDTVLGPFVFNYIANIIRASKNSSASTSPETLERKLLRGDVFSNVASINPEALNQLLASFEASGDAIEYRPQIAFSGQDDAVSEADLLRAKKQKLENALSRLTAIYLYDDTAMPEKDFVLQRSQISGQLEEVNAKLNEISAANSEMMSDDFIQKASYYIMANKLIEDRYIDFEKYIATIEPSVPKSFLNQIIDHIDVADGKVLSIKFKSGAEHKFTYK